MLTRLAPFVVRRRIAILVAAAIGLVVAGVLGGGVASKLSLGGFDDNTSESARVERVLVERFRGQSNVLFLVTAASGDVDSPAARLAGEALTAELARDPQVGFAVSYWTLGNPPPLKSRGGDKALVLAQIKGNQDEINRRAEEILPRFTRRDGVIDVRPGGLAAVFSEVGDIIEADTRRADSIALPITLVLLVLVFGSVVAATLPLAVGIFAIVGTFLILALLNAVTEVSVYALSLTTALGLGLAIDYALFIVSRHREEVRAGRSYDEAVQRTVVTAGRTVLFSALTVAASLGALLVFPFAFLRSMAYAGIAVVALATVGAVVVLPALLAVLGPKVEKWVLWRHTPPPVGEGRWHRLAMLVMRRPWPIAIGVGLVLLVLGAPFLGINLGVPDDRVLPKTAMARQTSNVLRAEFSSRESTPVLVLADDIGNPAQRRTDIEAYAAALSSLPGVARVDALTGSYLLGRQVLAATPLSLRFSATDSTYFSVVPSVEAISKAGERVVRAVRDAPAPFEVSVGGASAEFVDAKRSIGSKIPLAALLIAVATFVVLFLSFGSLLVPAKAVVLNLLSLTATFGAMVWVFQQGHLADLFGVTATGTLVSTIPILMFCIAFGLSMDYEVFLLARIKEEHDRTGDNTASVAAGLERTGRIVTAAALLISVVFVCFAATSGISFMKLFGVGMALAVIMDATLIRALLVPAVMKLAGEANWWAPAPMRRFYDRFGISERDTPALATVPVDDRPVLVYSNGHNAHVHDGSVTPLLDGLDLSLR